MPDSDTVTQTTAETLGAIQIGDGVYALVKTVTVVCDLVDANGNPIAKDGVTQSPNSVITFTGADLAGLDLPVQTVANKIYPQG